VTGAAVLRVSGAREKSAGLEANGVPGTAFDAFGPAP
jgi:hypothetical protein